MRTQPAKLIITALLVAASSAALAGGFDSRATRIGWHVRQPVRFMVSGVLRKNGTQDTIKPIHAIVEASDSDSAVREFVRSAQKQYPGYSLIATLASRVPAVGTCENVI
ncbi:hypothetical protein [Burkholderia multivorans]|uniref:hypothetical protein n=1 Tax=Burkholderia multivorans TaxID=87883 RepID=UPI00057FAE34|nr:hypothetical protein [Burkholderia multivorans]KHS09424.1 hypothetical protein BMD20_29580 [Burkholderia multivorans]KHS10379.1 hypothetical protein BMD22_28245 [Burkholderia multivorans]HDR9474411.1 hypothetical protein [Burkholderia multivorans]HDR9480253.1 hypothetical protein [Burkholderia multivorans]